MPNHIHLLLSTEETHIGRAMQMVKGGFSHAVGQAGLKLKAVWQPSYYEHRVAMQRGMRECGITFIKIQYADTWLSEQRNIRIRPPTHRVIWTRYPRG